MKSLNTNIFCSGVALVWEVPLRLRYMTQPKFIRITKPDRKSASAVIKIFHTKSVPRKTSCKQIFDN